jgi:hypothetical protein
MKELTVRNGHSNGTVSVPDGWLVVPTEADQCVAFPDPAGHADAGFLPNVTVRIDAAGVPDLLPSTAMVLTDVLQPTTGDEERRSRVALSRLEDETLMQLVATVRTAESLMSVVCTATDEQWNRLAHDFDAVASSTRADDAGAETA